MPKVLKAAVHSPSLNWPPSRSLAKAATLCQFTTSTMGCRSGNTNKEISVIAETNVPAWSASRAFARKCRRAAEEEFEGRDDCRQHDQGQGENADQRIENLLQSKNSRTPAGSRASRGPSAFAALGRTLLSR